EKKDAAAAEATAKGFGKFLDELAKAAKLTPDVILTLSQGYSAIGRHEEAIAQLRKYPTPAENPVEDRNFRTVQYLVGKELRLAKKYPEAKAHLEGLIKAGYKTIDLRFELVFLEEDQGHFSTAMKKWQELQAPFGKQYKPKPANPRELQINA